MEDNSVNESFALGKPGVIRFCGWLSLGMEKKIGTNTAWGVYLFS